MGQTAIKVEHLTKSFTIGSKSNGLLRDNIFNVLKTKAKPSIYTAIDDLSFELEQGQSLGMVGKNGAGKSTLLKIISKITRPTSGKVEVYGRVASLLEVGTGFHQELTGRENIYLSGAVMGMKHHEIKKKYDEIVDFSGVETFLETPVKRYSSGMYVRLAFAVAAHLESDILLVDEVLAVGDAEFQKKCLGKMESVTNVNGRTVIFVSHNMQVIKQLCTKALYLNKGTLEYYGDTNKAVDLYLSNKNVLNENFVHDKLSKQNDPDFAYTNIEIKQKGENLELFQNAYTIEVEISFDVKTKIIGLQLGLDVLDMNGTKIFRTFFYENTPDFAEMSPPTLMPGSYTSTAIIPADTFLAGKYTLNVSASIYGNRMIAPSEGLDFEIEVIETGKYLRSVYQSAYRGLINLPIDWTTKSK